MTNTPGAVNMSLRNQIGLRFFLLIVALVLLGPAHGAAQSLAVGSATGAPGGSVNVDVSFTAGATAVSTLQFDLSFPSSLTPTTTTTGSAATAAGKSASASATTGGMRILVFGLSQTAISSGPVVTISFTIIPSASAGQTPINIANIAASDPGGNVVSVSGSGGTVTISAAADTTPPAIGAVAAVAGSAGATISWTTNEISNSQVEYGTSTSYSAWTTLNSSLVTAHTEMISGLLPATVYHYRVKSRDVAGNLATSGDFTFTTLTPADTSAPTISGVTASGVTGNKATITWTTNEASNSQVNFGTTAGYGSSSSLDTKMVTAHIQTLSGLSPSTVYHYRVRSTDAAGNGAVSADFSFTTSGAQDSTPPVISSVSAIPSATGAIVRWTTNEPADSGTDYGTTHAYGSTIADANVVTSHSQSLTGLQPATTYHFRVKSKDPSGNLARSDDFSFTTSEVNDKKAPEISLVQAVDITGNEATITWVTDEPADSQVEYGASATYGSQSRLDGRMQTSHSELIRNLTAKTRYHFRVISTDAAGNTAISHDYTFMTAEDTRLTLSYPRPKATPPGRAKVGGSDYTGVALANFDSRAASLTFTVYDAAGLETTAPGLTNPVTRLLKPGEQMPVVDDQLFGEAIHATGDTGWIKIDSTSEKVAGFFLTFNSEMTTLDGTNILAQPMTSFVLPEIEDRGFNSVNIANPNPEPVELSFELVRSDGTTRATTTQKVNAKGALVADLFPDLFHDIAPVASNYVRVRAGNGVLPFELLGQESRYIEALNGQPAGSGSQTLYSPQYAVGGAWRTALSVVNLDAAPGTVTFRFVPNDGSQMGIGAAKVVPIEPRGKIYIDDPTFFQSLVNANNEVVQGYVEIISSGIRLTGSVVFGDPARERFSSALPLISQLQTSLTFTHVSSNEHFFTGIAMLNPGTTNTYATVQLYGADGTLEASKSVVLLGRQRRAMLLTELFPGLVGQDRTSGFVKVTAEKEIAAFAVFGTHDLSALSAIPPQ